MAADGGVAVIVLLFSYAYPCFLLWLFVYSTAPLASFLSLFCTLNNSFSNSHVRSLFSNLSLSSPLLCSSFFPFPFSVSLLSILFFLFCLSVFFFIYVPLCFPSHNITLSFLSSYLFPSSLFSLILPLFVLVFFSFFPLLSLLSSVGIYRKTNRERGLLPLSSHGTGVGGGRAAPK